MEKNEKISAVSTAGIGIIIFAAIVVAALIVYWIGVAGEASASAAERTAVAGEILPLI